MHTKRPHGAQKRIFCRNATEAAILDTYSELTSLVNELVSLRFHRGVSESVRRTSGGFTSSRESPQEEQEQQQQQQQQPRAIDY